jgi:hypothetical protein
MSKSAVVRRLMTVTAMAAALGMPAALNAQACTTGHPQLTFSLLPTIVLFPVPTQADYLTGTIAATNGLTAAVATQQNRNWELCIRSDAPDLGGGGDKPLDHLEWRVPGDPGWKPLLGSNAVVATGQGSGAVAIEFRAVLDWWADAPATYEAPIVITLGRL